MIYQKSSMKFHQREISPPNLSDGLVLIIFQGPDVQNISIKLYFGEMNELSECCLIVSLICEALLIIRSFSLTKSGSCLLNISVTLFSFAYLQVYWLGPVLGAVLAGVSHEFFFARSASRQKLVACLTCKDIEIVETTSMTGSSLSTVTQNAIRAKQANKQENNWTPIY